MKDDDSTTREIVICSGATSQHALATTLFFLSADTHDTKPETLTDLSLHDAGNNTVCCRTGSSARVRFLPPRPRAILVQ